MKKAVIYIHGKGGSAEEAAHYAALFPNREVFGFDYLAETPWEAVGEFSRYFDGVHEKYPSVVLVANSLGAYFALHSLREKPIEKAYFISPVVDMERLIADLMQWAGVSEAELMEKGEIRTDFGETLSAEYLLWVRAHPVLWKIPTSILYGSRDHLQSADTVRSFAEVSGAALTVMEGGEHWFHTEEQMQFLDRWIGK